MQKAHIGCHAFASLIVAAALACPAPGADFGARFDEIKRSASPAELYAFLFALPKGGDLHHHNGLSAYGATWYAAATSPKTLARNSFYTMTKLGNCSGDSDARPRFYTVQRATFAKLSTCQQGEFEALEKLSPEMKAAWLSSLVLDRPGEGRKEFFDEIVLRFGDLNHDPYLAADVIVENMKLFGAEGVRYIESQSIPAGFLHADGRPMDPEDANRIIEQRLHEADAAASGVEIRFQDVVIRFLPNAEQEIERAYAWVAAHRDRWVGINMAGIEDNSKGYALRFLDTYRRMRRTYSDIPLSIHAGEKDSPGHEVHDTLLLGASRIGHGVNLISDPDTMLLMRNNVYLVEINLISNRVLEYVPDTSKHPFPEYLRTGIPVCLNTDDRGAWGSNMTDEYYTAVTTFNLSWKEVVDLGRNSLTHSFAEDSLKAAMLGDYDRQVHAFEGRFAGDWRGALKGVKPLVSQYAGQRWGFHE